MRSLRPACEAVRRRETLLQSSVAPANLIQWGTDEEPLNLVATVYRMLIGAADALRASRSVRPALAAFKGDYQKLSNHVHKNARAGFPAGIACGVTLPERTTWDVAGSSELRQMRELMAARQQDPGCRVLPSPQPGQYGSEAPTCTNRYTL